MTRRLLVLALVAAASSAAGGQAPTEPPRDAAAVPQASPRDSVRKGRARILDSDDGQLDVSALLENPRGFLPIPIVVTEPAVGYGGGLVGMFVRPRREAGAEGWARPDLSAVGVIATQNGTRALFAVDARRRVEGRLRTMAGAGTGTVNLDFYGLELDADRAVRYSLQFTGAVAQANWQLAPRSPWALGLRYVYSVVEPRLRDAPVFPFLVDRARVALSAPTAILEFDTRDNLFTPTRGVYGESSWLTSREALGASDNFERFQQILMGFRPLSHAVMFGARADYAWSSAGTPFFLQPFVQLRGVPAMRFRGSQMTSAEAEARWQFVGRWSLVAFGGAGATRAGRDALAATASVGSGGVGFRYQLARKFGLHAGIDVGHSAGTTALYFQVGNAWFRP